MLLIPAVPAAFRVAPGSRVLRGSGSGTPVRPSELLIVRKSGQVPPSGTRSRSRLPALFPGAVLILAEALSPGSGADPQSAPGLTAAFPCFPAAPRPWERDLRGCFPSVRAPAQIYHVIRAVILSVPIANARNTWYLFSMKVSSPFMRIVYNES